MALASPQALAWYPRAVADSPMDLLNMPLEQLNRIGGTRARMTLLHEFDRQKWDRSLSGRAYEPRRPDVVIDWPLPSYLRLDLSGSYVYALVDPDWRVSYVGKTGSLSARWGQHAVNKSFVRSLAWRSRRGETDLELEKVIDSAFQPYLKSDGTTR